MVAFRSLTPELIQQNLQDAVSKHEATVWELAASVGIDPRGFKLDYVLPEPVGDDQQQGEKALLEAQARVLTTYTMMGVDTSVFGSNVSDENKIAAVEAALERNEVLMLSRCAEFGVNPEDIEEGWTARVEGEKDFEVLIARVFLLQKILDELSA